MSEGCIKAVFGGAVGGGDTWSVGLNIGVGLPAANGGATPTEMNTVASDLLGFFNTFWTTYKTWCRSGTSLSSCKTYLYGTGGLLTSQGTATQAAVVGTGTVPHPSYVATVVTLQTDTPGRRGRGRIYLPATGRSCDASTGQSDTSPSAFGAALKIALNAMAKNYTLSGTTYLGVPVVWSEAASDYHPIVAIRSDTILETQRGRQDQSVATTVYSVAL